MRHVRLLGLTLLALLSLGALAAASASAVESGLLPLEKTTLPLIELKGEVTALQTLTTLGLKTVKIEATKVKFSGTLCKEEPSHCTLGSLAVTYEGVKLGLLGCSSENAKGEKDAKEVVLLKAPNTDLHLVSLENGGKLVPGILVGLLEEEKHDLTLNCGGGKTLVLGAVFLEVKEVKEGTDVKEFTVLPAPVGVTCATTDSLCKTELEKWGAIAVKKVKEGEDVKVLCPLAAFIEKEEECSDLSSGAPIPVKLSTDVLVDF